MIELRCAICGKKFKVYPYRKNQKCCSKKCCYEYRKIKNQRIFIKINELYSEMVIPCIRHGEKRVLVDNEDIEKIKGYIWHIRKQFDVGCYVITRHNNETLLLHRLIMDTPKHLEVDHINRNPLDNRKINLRNCTREVNQSNKRIQQNISRRNKTGYVGVSFCKRDKRYKVYLSGVNLGYYKTFEEAKQARINAVQIKENLGVAI